MMPSIDGIAQNCVPHKMLNGGSAELLQRRKENSMIAGRPQIYRLGCALELQEGRWATWELLMPGIGSLGRAPW